MTARTDPADEQSGEIALRVDRLVGRCWEQFLTRAAELGLSAPEAKLLRALETDDGLPMRAVAGRLHANPSNVTVLVARLEGRGLLERLDGADRRVRSIRLTASGARLRDRLNERLLSGHPALQGLSPTQRTALVRILRQLDRSAD